MTVLVRGLTFHSHHGIAESEREVGQWLEADIEVDTSGEAGRTDQIDDTVNYVDLAQLLVDTSNLTGSHTLEHLADRFAFAVLERWPQAVRVQVELRKNKPLVTPTIAAVGVRLVKSRQL